MTAACIGQAAAAGVHRRLRLLRWLVAIAVLAPVWLVPRDVWDGVIGAYGIARHDFSGIYHWLIPSNWGLVYLMLRGIELLETASGVPAWVWVKLLLSASVIGLAREARLLCRRVLGWDERASRFAELVALSFPCWYVLYGSTFIYLVFIWCIFAGHRLLHESAGLASRAGGLLLVLLSFQVNSNFVMVFALEGMRWLYRPRGQRWNRARSALVLGAAVVVYLGLRLIWTPSGPYQGYNDLVWPFSAQGAVSWIRAAAMAGTWVPLLIAPALVAWLAGWGKRRAAAVAESDTRREAAAIGLLLAGAMFAYLAVGKGAPLFIIQLPQGWLGTGTHLGKAAAGWIYTTGDGWSIRNGFLLSLPAGIAVAWLARRAVALGSRQEGAWRAALAAALLVNFAFLADGHVKKLARFAQEQSIVRALREQAPPLGGTVDLQLAQAVGWSAWTYETNYLFWLAYRRAEWAAALFGPDERSRRAAQDDRRNALVSPLPRSHFLMDEMPMRGCHTSYQVQLPASIGAATLVLDSLGLRVIPAARVVPQETNCPRP